LAGNATFRGPLLSKAKQLNRLAIEYQKSLSEAPAAGFFGLSNGLHILYGIRGIKLGNLLAHVQNSRFLHLPVYFN
jgi:hypothetical protein